MKKKILLITIIIFIIFLILYFLYIFNYIPHKKYSNYYFDIDAYTSDFDMDKDGIDDQTDILNSVREYISTKPKYKSKYYANGYPDDGYGTCVDVVAFGVLNAGYDLMKLVNEDIRLNKEQYNIDVIDKNIDFRRVDNLKVFFKNNAISLTLDVSDIKNWQGGDIVIFENHIGIISNNRNKKGIPFVIHHASKYQLYYEEDILEHRNDIVGHYRMS